MEAEVAGSVFVCRIAKLENERRALEERLNSMAERARESMARKTSMEEENARLHSEVERLRKSEELFQKEIGEIMADLVALKRCLLGLSRFRSMQQAGIDGRRNIEDGIPLSDNGRRKRRSFRVSRRLYEKRRKKAGVLPQEGGRRSLPRQLQLPRSVFRREEPREKAREIGSHVGQFEFERRIPSHTRRGTLTPRNQLSSVERPLDKGWEIAGNASEKEQKPEKPYIKRRRKNMPNTTYPFSEFWTPEFIEKNGLGIRGRINCRSRLEIRAIVDRRNGQVAEVRKT